MQNLVDVHTHLTDPRFTPDLDEVIRRAIQSGLRYMISNGLNPETNRQVLRISWQYPEVLPALGIYPVDAVNDQLREVLPFEVARFDVDQEIAFIADCAAHQRIVAVGECGLDGHWLGQESFRRQEEVFEKLIEIAKQYDLPLIIHTRSLEKRSIEILQAHQVMRVDFHCFGGKTQLAIKGSENAGWYFSIPANARKSQNFTKMLKELPLDRILTETDAPYLSPQRGERNSPENIPGTIDYLAELRGMSREQAAETVMTNFMSLFGASLSRLNRQPIAGL
jgi:TatD DNase family protein